MTIPATQWRGVAATESEPEVIVVVLNWNLKDDLAECLASLDKATYPSRQVVVVDNASSDGSAEMVRARFPAVRLIVNEQNLGFAAGNNVGLRYGLAQEAAYLLLLNNDTVIAADMLTRLVAAAEADQELGILGPQILYYGTEDRVWYLGHRTYRWLPVPRRIAPRLAARAEDGGRIEVDYVSGCSMLIRRQVLLTAGLLDEALFMHYEDADLCRRARQAGYRLACVPGARMWHKVSQSSSQVKPAVRRLQARNRVLFYRRYPHGPHPWLTAAFVLVTAVVTMARDLLRGRSGLIQPHVQGLYEGFTWKV